MYKTIACDISDGIAIVRLNRPESLNAYTVQMGEDLVAAFKGFQDNDSVKAVVLTGNGRGFCAGVDLKVLKETREKNSPDDGLPTLGEEYFVNGFCNDLYDFPKPIIVAINGAAIGVGVTMALPCDIRIAGSSAKLGIPFAKLGIVPGLGSTFMLPRLLGPGKAKLLALTGRTISAEEAAEMGLIDKLVADDALMDEAIAIAREISACSPKVISLINEALDYGITAENIADAADFEDQQNARR